MNYKKAINTIAFLVVLMSATASYAISLEYKVKAGLIYNILKFVELKNYKNGQINLCVVGSNPFGTFLNEFPSNVVKGKKIVINFNYSEFSDCTIAYISRSEEKKASSIISEMSKYKILTISDIDRFARLGGMIEFGEVSGNIVMDFNASEAKSQGVLISSKLLQIGRRVY